MGTTRTELVLRTCNADMTSHEGFVWPESGPVEAPDWDPGPRCGEGLHGFLRGEGDGFLADCSSTAKWLVVEVDADCIVDLRGKGKFPRGRVIYAGTREEATRIIGERYPGCAVIGGASTSGDYGASTSGDYGASTSGDWGASISGAHGTSTSGDFSTSTSGYRGTSVSDHDGASTSGHHGTSTSGDHGTSTSGAGGTSTSGYRGTSTSGYHGTSTSGARGTSTSGRSGASVSGDHGTSVSGECGTSTSGRGGTIAIWHDDGERRRLVVGYIGENGLLPDVPYRLDENGEFVRADEGE